MTDPSHLMSARFLGEEGRRFMSVDFKPLETPRACILFLPPFGEEMNRCRALVAQQARQFAESGYRCTVIDYYGTGDSQGELYEASFDIWYSNIHFAIEALAGEQGAPVILWGLRLGGLIALDFAARSQINIQDIILWQPVTSGKRYVTQMLRQRVASLVGKDLTPETTTEIRQRLEEGEHVEISGYTVGGGLVRDIEMAVSFGSGKLCSGNIYWLENVSESGQAIGTASNKVVAKLEQQENRVEVHVFTDPPLWQLHKRDDAPELLEITGRLLP